MTANPALDWLHADFEQGLQRYEQKLRRGALDRQWRGPSAIRPMIQLRPSVDHRCQPMRVTQADYHDPERWWL
jgi:hypothetical protein